MYTHSYLKSFAVLLTKCKNTDEQGMGKGFIMILQKIPSRFVVHNSEHFPNSCTFRVAMAVQVVEFLRGGYKIEKILPKNQPPKKD